MRILILGIIIPLIGFYQENTGVDSIEGYAGFRFNDHYSKYKKNLRLNLIISFQGEQKYYEYTGREMKKIYGFRTEKVTLGFQNDSLFYIDAYFKGLKKDEFLLLSEKFESEFGEASYMDNPEDRGVESGYQWVGENKLSQLILYNEDAIDEYEKEKVLFIIRLQN